MSKHFFTSYISNCEKIFVIVFPIKSVKTRAFDFVISIVVPNYSRSVPIYARLGSNYCACFEVTCRSHLRLGKKIGKI